MPLPAARASSKRIDFRLPLGGDGGEIGAIAVEERVRLMRSATSIPGFARAKRWYQGGHLADDLTLDHADLVPRLPAGVLHAPQFHVVVDGGDHAASLPFHDAKLDGPSNAAYRVSSMTKPKPPA